jgi:HD-like signal output (HDOD) protein
VQLVRAIETPFAFLAKLSPHDQSLIASALRVLPCSKASIDQAREALTGEADLRAFSSVVSKDPGLALRVFQLANSAYFGRPANTLSIYDAVSTIGSDVLLALLYTDRLVDVVESPTTNDVLSAISKCAVSSAQMLVEMSLDKGASEAEAEAAYSTGLLSWVGEVLVSSAAVQQMSASMHVNAVSVSSYAATLLGIPTHMSATIASLANLRRSISEPEERAAALASLMFDKAVA